MARDPRQPVFLARDSYRQRRLRDIARVLPVVGALAVLLPLMWDTGAEGARTSTAVVYLFGVWVVLILAAFLLSRSIRPDAEGSDAAGEDD